MKQRITQNMSLKEAVDKPKSLFIYTENVWTAMNRHLLWRNGNGTSVVRTAENSLPIFTKKKYVYKEIRHFVAGEHNVNWEKDDYDVFCRVNEQAVRDILRVVANYNEIVWPKYMASGLATLPSKKFALALCNMLKPIMAKHIHMDCKPIQTKKGWGIEIFNHFELWQEQPY